MRSRCLERRLPTGSAPRATANSAGSTRGNARPEMSMRSSALPLTLISFAILQSPATRIASAKMDRRSQPIIIWYRKSTFHPAVNGVVNLAEGQREPDEVCQQNDHGDR